MYVYYEVFKGSKPSEDVHDFVLSSNGRTNQIDWKITFESSQAKAIQQFFKTCPLAERTYNERTHIWTFTGVYGSRLIAIIESGITAGLFNQCKLCPITQLEEKTLSSNLDGQIKSVEGGFKEQDFFYNPHGAVASTGVPTGEALNKKIALLLSVDTSVLSSASDSELKKLYRKAALTLHPDRNGGDGSKMSELNMLWGIFMEQV